MARDPGHIVEHPNPPGVLACLNRAVRRAMARDKVKRNVVELTEVPAGLPGRPSKALTTQQADDVITKTASGRMHPYISSRCSQMRACLSKTCPGSSVTAAPA